MALPIRLTLSFFFHGHFEIKSLENGMKSLASSGGVGRRSADWRRRRAHEYVCSLEHVFGILKKREKYNRCKIKLSKISYKKCLFFLLVYKNTYNIKLNSKRICDYLH